LPDFSALLTIFPLFFFLNTQKVDLSETFPSPKSMGENIYHSPLHFQKNYSIALSRGQIFLFHGITNFFSLKIFLCFPSEKIGRKILEYTLLLLQKNYSMALSSGQIFLFYPGILDSFPHDSVKRPFA